MRGATAWEWQWGRLWVHIRYPSFWLYRPSPVSAGPRCRCHRCRRWFFYWPGFVRLVGAEDG